MLSSSLTAGGRTGPALLALPRTLPRYALLFISDNPARDGGSLLGREGAPLSSLLHGVSPLHRTSPPAAPAYYSHPASWSPPGPPPSSRG